MSIAIPPGMKTRPIVDVHQAMKTTSLPLMLALAMFSQGCIVVEDPSPGPSPGPAPSPPPPSPTPVPPPPADGLLRIDNDSSFDFYDIYVTPINAPSWGPDLLDRDVLFPGESLTLEVGCDFYDAMVVDEFGNECVIESLDLCNDSAIWRVTDDVLADCGGFGRDSELTIQNSSNFVLEEIYVTPVDVFDWGPDQLGNDVLFPGESVTIELACDVYDVLVVDELGTECMLFDLDLCFDNGLWVITNSVLDFCDFGVTTSSVTSSSAAREQRAMPEKRQKEPMSRAQDALSDGELL
jgi:hypothetical protein